ncbi:MAG: DUF2029 domain-containing protein [Acidobacteria bacterium]|nr:DUF2029 domain-containing protein [Acidobacteriota bacterium]NIM60480.1 DUF2029 domain-containing protein [Acidobacteriota bacterium]NIO60377.1 DUF2029 domain-containing protein [Acidobacteriota bacterium]NIQ31449.1 DUF2029 domain-containing protein [Acidobacteriota bacterium]NIQ86693.1 DUF2029 domain-containing protein [Acidobacteriota bacterium]
MIQHTPPDDNPTAPRVILAAGLVSGLLYVVLALIDLREHLATYLVVHAALLALMGLAWRRAVATPSVLRWVFAGAVLFRLITAFAAPTLSDDLYRYVWDGRVQVAGIHPYVHAPEDPALAALRDDAWSRINHPELRTIYPPLAQVVFAALAFLGAGPLGFKLFFAAADIGVLAALIWLLRRTKLPPDRAVLYAWNPLAVIETAGSGHVEPVGVALVVLCAVWMNARRAKSAALALAAAVQVKLLPVVLIPGAIRRWRNPAVLVLVAVLVLLALPYALTGPAIGSGLFDYTARWERNAVVYSGIEGLLEWVDTGRRLKPMVGTLRDKLGGGEDFWNRVYTKVWPREIARGIVAVLALAWVVRLSFRRGLTAPREIYLGLAGVLLLVPTLHPWYVLWVLPFAAAYRSVFWLCFAGLVPLAYVGGASDVPWLVRSIEYGLPLLTAILCHRFCSTMRR